MIKFCLSSVRAAAAHIEGVEFATWFGGGDDTWAPPQDTYTMFRNFRVWRDDPPADITAQAVMESLPHGQVVVQEYMQPGV